MAPKLNRRRALFVLEKIDEILHWEQQTERERDTRFVDLGRYLCEVRAGQYWRVDNLKSFDEFLESTDPRLGRGSLGPETWPIRCVDSTELINKFLRRNFPIPDGKRIT
jgi:hypothetical protein